MTKEEYGDFALRYKGCGACFPMYHTLSRFEKMWFTAIQKDVAELEKENVELKARIGLSIDCEKAHKDGELCLGYGGDEDEPCEQCKNCIKCECGYYQLGETEKDEQLQKWKDEWQEQVQKATDEGYARTLQTIQLSKAKDLLKNLLSAYTSYADSFDDRDNEIVAEAEQFLSKVEK